jgi:hypothetical protein
VDQPDLAQHGAAIRTVAARPVGLDHPFPAGQCFIDEFGGGRAGIDVALDLRDAELAHRCQLVVRFDTLGRGLHLQRLGQADDRGNDRSVAIAFGHPGDEALVDLDLVERRVLQIAERGIARPEIVQRQPHAQQLQRLNMSTWLRHRPGRRIRSVPVQAFRPAGSECQRLGHHDGKPALPNCAAETLTATRIARPPGFFAGRCRPSRPARRSGWLLRRSG